MSDIRPLTTLNHLFLNLSSVVDGNACDLIELEGRIDHQTLEEAIRLALRQHPVLNSRVKRRLFDYVWKECDVEMPIDFRVEHLSELQWETLHRHLMENVWKEPVDLYKSRPVRFHLTESGNYTILQIVSNHVWSDAHAGYRLAFDIARCYSALSEGNQPILKRIDLPDRNNHHVFKKHLTRSNLNYWFQAATRIVTDLVSKDRWLELRGKRGPTGVKRYALAEHLLPNLKQTARSNDVSLHAYLVLALLRACQKYNTDVGKKSNGTYRILDLFSLRNFSPEKVGELYDSLVVPFNMRLESSRSDKELITEITNYIEQLKNGEIMVELFRQRLYAIGSMLLPKRFATKLVSRLVAKSNVICTNPGVIPYPIDSFGPVPIKDFYSFSQLFPPGRIMLIFSTFRGKLRLIVVYDTEVWKDKLEPFINSVICNLNSIATNMGIQKSIQST